MASQELAATYHPIFNTLDAGEVLSSIDGALYRLPSLVLRRTATFFASSSFTFEPKSKSIPIHEHDVVLERLLRISNSLAIPPWRTFDDIEGVLSLAETWGARGALDIWEEEAEFASKHTVELIPPRGAAPRGARGDDFQAGMENDATCRGCGNAADGSAWMALVSSMFWETDARPSGDTLCLLEIEEWPEMETILSGKCSACGRLVYDRLEVLERVRKCLAKLLDTV
ncbi:hypothetical protein ARMGADRAFT_1089570 [Armillaria gallica]|uniref:BTB domain-containing protein n=1 Tax=Armillaria gallica TaxID=47427 RepID=A0A2H3D4H5_ARMGA|nr:hypothetical protein ARMGADRAFT_1089570 [Armillaria gallica]